MPRRSGAHALLSSAPGRRGVCLLCLGARREPVGTAPGARPRVAPWEASAGQQARCGPAESRQRVVNPNTSRRRGLRGRLEGDPVMSFYKGGTDTQREGSWGSPAKPGRGQRSWRSWRPGAGHPPVCQQRPLSRPSLCAGPLTSHRLILRLRL